MAKPGSLDSFGAILSGLAKRLGLESRLVELRLQHRWRDIMGEPIASHTWPDQIRFKKLYVTVPNSVWLQQLTFLKPTLLAKLTAEAGADLIADLVLRVGEMPAPLEAHDQAADNPARPISDAAPPEEVSAHLSAIQDPALRQRLTEVIGTYPSQAPPQAAADPSHVP
jgi:predicted nucleic acid-binding Zn ribbon protein